MPRKRSGYWADRRQDCTGKDAWKQHLCRNQMLGSEPQDGASHKRISRGETGFMTTAFKQVTPKVS